MRYVLILLTAVAVGCHGASSSGSAPPDAARAQTTALSARTPVPPMTGQGATANPSEVTPTPTVTPVEEGATALRSVATPQPDVTVTQALKAQLDEQPVSTGEGAGSSPAQGSTPYFTKKPIPEISAPAFSLPENNESQVRAAVQALWPASEWETAMRVSWCESRYDPAAVEPSGDHEGVWQVDASLHGAVPGDIYSQTVQAYGIWQQVGWSAWSCR